MPEPHATLSLDLPNEAATRALGAALARILRPGDTLLLDGPYGAGKTTLARALLRAMTGDPDLEVPSPSFALVQQYDTPSGEVRHFDLWRVENPAELPEIGWDPLSDAIALVEWPERLGGMTPPGAITVALDSLGEDGRQARISGPARRIAGLNAPPEPERAQ